jgi:hypothetical protein
VGGRLRVLAALLQRWQRKQKRGIGWGYNDKGEMMRI